MSAIRGEIGISGKGNQEAICDSCRSSEKLNAPIVDHFTGVHPQAVSVHQNFQRLKISDQFFWGDSTF
jgi:hypothetical protein